MYIDFHFSSAQPQPSGVQCAMVQLLSSQSAIPELLQFSQSTKVNLRTSEIAEALQYVYGLDA